jgi:hypothetical protein
LSEAQVWKELAEEEGTRLEQGGIAIHSTSASAFLVMGLELEDNQYVYYMFLSHYWLTISLQTSTAYIEVRLHHLSGSLTS